MTRISDWLDGTLGMSRDFQGDLAATLVLVVTLWLLRWFFLRVTAGRVGEPHAVYRWRKLSGYVTTIVGLFVLAGIWFEAFRSVSTFLGLLSAGLAIALRDPVVNLAGWAFIVWRKPFEVGDRIEIAGHAGDVIDLRIFQFSLMEIGNWVDADQPTGRIVHVSNSKVFTEAVANYTKPFRYVWHEIPVLVTFESDWEKAKGILEELGHRYGESMSEAAAPEMLEASRRFMLPAAELTSAVYMTVRESGVLLTLRYLTEPRRRRATEQVIWEDALREFAKQEHIEFAYPTQRFFNNVLEGKAGTKPHAQEETAQASAVLRER